MAALKRKPVQLIIVLLLAVGIVLAGAFAWSSFNQSRINVFKDLIVPNVNLHDDFYTGPNKDVYVENSGESPVFLRVRLTEYLQTEGRGPLVEDSVRDDDKAYLWSPHNGIDKINTCTLTGTSHTGPGWGGENFHDYYTWFMGGQNPDNPTAQIYYKSAAEEQKGGINADGTERQPQVVGDPLTGTSAVGDASAEYAAQMALEIPRQETLRLEELKAGGMAEAEAATQAAKEAEGLALEALGLKKTQEAYVITMTEWIAGAGEKNQRGYRAPYVRGDFWVIDEADGWCYWANALEQGQATGLLLDRVERTGKKFDSDAQYAVNVWLQAVTEEDLGQFAAQGGGISANGQLLLELATGQYLRAADGGIYKDNGDGTWFLSKDADGNEIAEYRPFAALGAVAGEEINAPEENRLYVGQRLTLNPMADWDGNDYVNWGDLAATTGPWYNLSKSTVTDAATDGGRQIYEFTGAQQADGVTYLTLTAVEAENLMAAGSRITVVPTQKSGDGAYGSVRLGEGPFAPIWAGGDRQFGTEDDTRLNPTIDIGSRSFTHIGNGVYMVAEEEGAALLAAETESAVYYFAGRLLNSAAMEAMTGKTPEETISAVFPLQLAVGDRFDLTGGETVHGETSPITGYTKSTEGKYTLAGVTVGADGKCYLYLGSERLGYIGPGADGYLGGTAVGGADTDVRTWTGGEIGGGTDTTQFPGDFSSEPFLKGWLSEELASGRVFTADGFGWVVLDVDEYGNRLIAATDTNIETSFNPGLDSNYTGSRLETLALAFPTKSAPSLKPYVLPVDYTQASLTTVGTAYEGGSFALSLADYKKYKAILDANWPKVYYGLRDDNGSGTVLSVWHGGTVFQTPYVRADKQMPFRPAMWVRFSDADEVALASGTTQAELDAWKATGTIITMGNYPDTEDGQMTAPLE